MHLRGHLNFPRKPALLVEDEKIRIIQLSHNPFSYQDSQENEFLIVSLSRTVRNAATFLNLK